MHKSNSKVQMDLEKSIKKSQDLSIHNKDILIGGKKCNVDIYDEDKGIIGEITVGIDSLSENSKKKLGTDVLKLLSIPLEQHPNINKKQIIVTNEKAKKYLNNSWVGEAAKLNSIEIILHKLTPNQSKKLKLIKIRQASK